MQSISSRIWTRVAVLISYDDNHYTTGTSLWYWIFFEYGQDFRKMCLTVNGIPDIWVVVLVLEWKRKLIWYGLRAVFRFYS